MKGQEVPAVHARNVCKSYGDFSAVSNLDLTVRQGELVTLLGPSGCGKTTVLRMIAGFVTPSSGQIAIAGTIVNDIPPHKRRVGLMFQSYALFPHMTVGENVAFGLKMRGVAKAEIATRVARALQSVRLESRIDAYPRQLSGGQQQRVALARALVINPDILLLDEPFGALDRELRQHLQTEMKQLQRNLGVSTLLVTHDQEEALLLSDRVAVMHAGRLEQVAPPEMVFERPSTRFVAQFMGGTNILEGSVKSDPAGPVYALSNNRGAIRLIETEPFRSAADRPMMIRPERIALAALAESAALPAKTVMTGRVKEESYLGATREYRVAVDGPQDFSIIARKAVNPIDKAPLDPGTRVGIIFMPDAVHILQ